jgi:arylsulfate sulfotransferase
MHGLMHHSARVSRCAALALTAIALSSCGGDSNDAASSSTSNAASQSPAVQPTQAAASDIVIYDDRPGASPFISLMSLRGQSISSLAAVEFTIAPKPGTVSKPVDVWYAVGALTESGNLASNDALISVPIVGLYAGYENQVALQLQFQDGSTQSLAASITTAAYTDPNGIYDRPNIIVKRAAGSALGFDFFFMKSAFGSPIVVDTDGEIRWLAPSTNGATSAYQNGEFVIGDAASPTVHRLQLDGTISNSNLAAPSYTEFHHNIDPGNRGLLAGVNTESAGVANIESTVVEMTDDGSILNQWDMAAILSAYMTSEGDNASEFVRPGEDWFHHNATAYDPTDDTIIVSSRENFLIKLDYRTGTIIWIFGDPTKYWYTFPSLRAKALTLATGGLYPIGQHGISITSDGLLMLFDDGDPSANQPAGAPAGQALTYSPVVAYSIDAASMTAQEAWSFDYGQTLFSPVCSSVYEALGQSILVDYAVTDGFLQARLVGLDANHNVVFDFEYANPANSCDTSWNARPIALDNLIVN